MKLTRRELLKTLCIIPFMTVALPEKKSVDSLSGILLVPPELEPVARELIASSFCLGDRVSLDDNGKLVHFKGDKPIFGVVIGHSSGGIVEVEMSRRRRIGHD